jgi:DNA-binding PadR family transcriptional regulator
MAIRGALLHLLAAGPAHGYQLKGDFEAATGGIWPLNVGQVYTTLERLARDGAVAETGEGEGSQRTWRITEAGRAELADWLAATPVDGPPPRDELLAKVLLALAGDPALAGGVIDAQRSGLLTRLQVGRRAQRARGGLEAVAQDALLTRIEADLAWLDRCEDLLRRGELEPRATNGGTATDPVPHAGRRGRRPSPEERR